MDPVTASPSCLSVAVAVITPSGPLMLKSQSPEMLACAEIAAVTKTTAHSVDNSLAILRLPPEIFELTSIRQADGNLIVLDADFMARHADPGVLDQRACLEFIRPAMPRAGHDLIVDLALA